MIFFHQNKNLSLFRKSHYYNAVHIPLFFLLPSRCKVLLALTCGPLPLGSLSATINATNIAQKEKLGKRKRATLKINNLMCENFCATIEDEKIRKHG